MTLSMFFSFGYVIEMLHCPADERIDVRHERLSELGQVVFHPGRNYLVLLPYYKVVPFKVLELLGEDLLGNVHHLAVEFSEAKCPLETQVI